MEIKQDWYICVTNRESSGYADCKTKLIYIWRNKIGISSAYCGLRINNECNHLSLLKSTVIGIMLQSVDNANHNYYFCVVISILVLFCRDIVTASVHKIER